MLDPVQQVPGPRELRRQHCQPQRNQQESRSRERQQDDAGDEQREADDDLDDAPHTSDRAALDGMGRFSDNGAIGVQP